MVRYQLLFLIIFSMFFVDKVMAQTRSLCETISNGQVDIVKQAIENGIDVNHCAKNQYQSPLWYAATRGNIEIIRMLLEAGANHESKVQAIHGAATYGHPEAAQFLLESEADLNAIDKQGKTLLIGAAESGELQLVELLIKAGAGVNEHDVSGWNAALWAAYQGHFNIVKT